MRKTKIGKSIITVILTVIMVLEMILPCSLATFAAPVNEYKGGAGTKVSDRDTSTKYSESLGDNVSTEYAGRIWTDKSVYTDDVTYDTFGGGKETVVLNAGDNLGEDFLITYSALATTQSVSGQTQAPIDVVLIIDISGSMSNSSSNMDNNKSRIFNAVQAANNAIEKLMQLNPYTRVSVVAFSSNAQVLLPLDRYTKTTTVEREWIQTGNFGLQGHWQETEVEMPYFSLSRETGSNNYATLYTNAVASDGDTVEKSTSVQGGTNIQVGLYEGMQVLAEEPETTATINGAKVQRVPSVILLSDGSPTYSSDSRSWWAPQDNNNNGRGNGAYAGNGMKAILVGSYMKAAIDRNYKITNTSYSTTVYTVGMGITELSDNEKNLAYMTLDPGAHWNSGSTNTMKTAIKNYWDSYTANNNTGTLNIQVGNSENYSLTHPTTDYDVDADGGYDYVDDYYDADNASAVTDVFNAIVSNISITAPQVPTEIKGTNPISDGYITYADPIGEYMEVKDIKAIIYAGTKYTEKTSSTVGNKTTYTFSGTVDSAVYGHQELKNILITVEETDGKQTLVIKIPASVIPLRVNEVNLNADGTVKSHTNNGAFPARIIYSVGLMSEVTKVSDRNVTYIDKSKIASEYLAKNTNPDGTINFYSNRYTNTNKVNGATAGDATVEFEPSHNNTFYYILEDMPIYKDAEFKQQVAAEEGIENDVTYYYKDVYYHGSSVEVQAIARTGEQLNKTVIKTGTDGYLYRAAGSPRLNRILKFEGEKIANATKTAEDFYAPTFQYADGSTDAYDGKFVIYQGNNGVLSIIAGGNLEITKTVNAAEGLTAPDKTFEFTLNLDGENVNNGVYDYVITDADGKIVSTAAVSKNNTKLYLKDGQTATVFSLPPDTAYSVTETAVAGFTSESEGAQGTIATNKTAVAKFTNTYNVTPVVLPSGGKLKGEKQLDGREWGSKDKFSFLITPYNNAPLPLNYDAAKGVTVSGPDAAGGNTATFDFGSIEFKAPGVYRYTVMEAEPENDGYLPGMSYSRALFRIVVTVVDNGDGTLSIKSTDIQRLYDDDANPLFTYNNAGEIVMNDGQNSQDEIKFTNTYKAGSVVRVPVAFKDYTDNSGTNPLVSGMFDFKLEAVGVVENNVVLANSISKVPMPADSVNGVSTTKNEGKNVTFLPIEFTQNHIPQGENTITFRYNMSEVIPENKVNGMTYDETVYSIDVVVSIDEKSDILNVSAIYPNDERIVTFKNEYTPKPITANINGKKTLVGRDMKSGEEFEFNIVGADAATNNAVRQGIITVPSSTVAVKNGKDGEAVAFAFTDIKFNKAGTYSFTVSEAKGNASSVEYDDNTVNVTFVIDDAQKDGNLEVISVTYSNGKNAAEFINTYTTKFDDTPVSLSGTKNLTGKTLLEGEFFFDVEEFYNGTKVKEGLVSHTADESADANGVYSGNITFLKDATYSKAGKYEYYIKEQIPTPKVDGTTYDASQYRFTVIVEDIDYVGGLKITSTYLQKLNGSTWGTVSDIVFDNEYVPNPTTVTLPLIKKVISGERSAALQENEFKFEIEQVSADPEGCMELPATTVVGNAANGDVVFGAIKFTKAGTYTVSVTEVIPEDAQKTAGITYSTQVIVATYKVTDNRNGVLTATLTAFHGGETIINEYKAEPAEVEIEIAKILSGRLWEATDKFDFEVVVLDPATQESIKNGEIEFPLDEGTGGIATKTIDAEGEKITGKIKVNREGTYKFRVREITGSIPGVHYDSQPRDITITATDDSQNAKIQVKINGENISKVTLTFTNVYDEKSAELSGHDNLFVKKNFTGRTDDAWLDTDKFEFKLETADTTTATAVSNGDVVLPENASSLIVSNANKAHAHFGNILFEKAGTYKFKITEIDGGIAGVNYDLIPQELTVEVINNTQLGALVATVVENESDDLIFNNTYKANAVELEGRTNLDIEKSLVGRDWFNNDEFIFSIKPFGEVANAAIDAGDIIMPALTEIKIKGEDTEKTAFFGNITFKKAGIYVFVINETIGNIKNVSYDTHTYYVGVSVTDNGLGQLETEVSTRGSKVFVNTYTPDTVNAEIKGSKSLNGNRELKAGDFEFTIKAVTANAPMPEKTTVKNNGDGGVVFGTVEFSAEGTYVYEITENNTDIPGVTKDSKKVTATVDVTYDSATGKFAAEVSYVKEGGQKSDTFKFENTYKAEASDPISLTAKKKVTASEGNNFNLKGGEFSFVIEGTPGAPMPQNTTVSNDADGNINFGTVKFQEKGIYNYTIREAQGNRGGFTYDGTVYTVTVKVTDVIAEAKLKTEVKYSVGNDQKNGIVFDNKYNPKETSATIFGKKELNGGHKELEADEFEFTIKAKTENAPLPQNTTVTNAATGVFQFDTITYTKVGEYKYEITENDLGKHGYTYDDKVYAVTVTVTDEGTGELKATVAGVGTAQEPTVKFVNKYVPDDVDVTLGAEGELSKVLDGRDINDKEFEFAVLDGEEKEIATAKNNKDGKFEFTLNFTKKGTYNYTLIEKNNGVGGIAYDEKVYGVKIVISDDGGHLKADSVTYSFERQDVEEVVFNNTYKAAETEVELSAVKILRGRVLKDSEFKFVIKDANGKVIKTATNTKDGKIILGKIKFTEAGTYKYTVTEETGKLEGITYDNTEYTVEIEVTDDGKGKLNASKTVIKNKKTEKEVKEISFVNSYVSTEEPPVEPPKTGDSTNIGLWLALFFISGGMLVGIGVYGKKSKASKSK